MTTRAHIGGVVASGFDGVRTEFERNFAERGDIGAAVAAYWYGEKVVDLRCPPDPRKLGSGRSPGVDGDDAGTSETAGWAPRRRTGTLHRTGLKEEQPWGGAA